LYNRGQEYRRQRLSPDGDRCDWYAVSDTVLRGALSEWDPRAIGDSDRPIRFAFTRTTAGTYLAQRQLFTRLLHGETPDALSVEEAVLELLDRVVGDAYRDPDRRTAQPAEAPKNRRRAAHVLAHETCALLGRRFAEPLALADIAAAIGTSPFHLCRSFRRATGTTLHEYRNQLRLRWALEHLEHADTDLSQLALAAGYSSHSHFTASFRLAFGVTPSTARTIFSSLSASS
jgi:AraC-like DNA-binding protein